MRSASPLPLDSPLRRRLTWDGQPRHVVLREESRRQGSAGFHFLPGAMFTNGSGLFEVVYGCFGPRGGWVQGEDVVTGEGRIFTWPGDARRTCPWLRLIAPAPRVAAPAADGKDEG